MKSKKIIKFLAVIVALVLSVAMLVACGDKGDATTGTPPPSASFQPDREIKVGGAYEIAIKGVGQDSILVSKAQIKAMYFENIDDPKISVTYTDDNLCFPGNKDDLPKYKHTAKAVLLSAIFDKFAGKQFSEYKTIKIDCVDGYSMSFESSRLASENGEMAVAFEYDGIALDAESKSGELRTIFHKSDNNMWMKKVFDITFTTDTLKPPSPTELNVYDILSVNAAYRSDFAKLVEGVEMRYYGISIETLLSNGILSAAATDNMFITAWDKDKPAASQDYSAYISPQVYKNSFITDRRVVIANSEEFLLKATFNGVNVHPGMTIKNLISLAIGKSAIVNFEAAMAKYETDGVSEIVKILEHINMWDAAASYTLTDLEGGTTRLSGAIMKTATVSLKEGHYVLTFKSGDGELTKAFSKIAIDTPVVNP